MPVTGLAFLLSATVALSAQQPAPQATPPDSVVIGRVVDATTGAPLAGAIVTLSPSTAVDPRTRDSLSLRVLTSDNGEFVFGPMPASTYRFFVTASGYLSGGYGRQRPDAASLPLAVAEHEVVDNLTLKLWKGAVVSGTVTDEAGEPVIGSLVNVVRRKWTAGRANWELVGTPATDDRGVYRLPNLQPGEYTALVPGMRVSYPVGFAATAQTGPALLEISRYSTTVYPLNASGAPQPPSNNTTIGVAGSPANERVGGFVTQTPQESRSIAPGAAARRVYPTTFAPGVPSPNVARIISVVAGENASNLDIQLQLSPSATITGTVDTPSGPGVNVVVRLDPAEGAGEMADIGSGTAIGVTNAQGAFALYGVPAGQYMLRASQGLWRGNAPPAATTVPITVGDKDIANLSVSLKPAVQISGRVEFEGDRTKAPANQLVMLRDAYPMKLPPQGRVDGDGRFAVSAEPGTYSVTADSDTIARLGSGWFIKSAMTRGRDVATVPTQFNDDVTDLVVTLTDKPSGLSGTARTPTGAVDPTATVMIFPVDRSLWGNVPVESRAFRNVSVDRNGAFTARGLAIGEYFAIAIKADDVTQPGDPKFLEQLSRVADRVTVRDGEIVTHDLKTTVVR